MFNVGDMVVCIDPEAPNGGHKLEADKVYTVYDPHAALFGNSFTAIVYLLEIGADKSFLTKRFKLAYEAPTTRELVSKRGNVQIFRCRHGA